MSSLGTTIVLINHEVQSVYISYCVLNEYANTTYTINCLVLIVYKIIAQVYGSFSINND